MQQRIQRMIDLQNEEMKLSQHYEDDRDTNQQQQQQYSGYSSRASSTRGEPPESTIPPEFSTSSSSEPLKNKTMSRSVGGLSTLQDLSQAGGEDTASPEIANDSHWQPVPPDEPGVGKGTLYFNPEKMGSNSSGSNHWCNSTTNDSHLQSTHVGKDDHKLLMGFPEGVVGHMERATQYGSINPPPPPPRSSMLPENPHYGQPPTQQNLHHQSPYDQYHDYHGPGSQQQQQQQRQQQTPSRPSQSQPPSGGGNPCVAALRMAFRCWRQMLCMCFCCCSTDAIEQEQLHRSFCYGAIDGMLTGSGIVAAFCGMDVLAPTSNLAVRGFVVAFSAAACFADSVCMAMGHVWTTYVLITAGAKERNEQRLAIENNRADAKGKLVDLLLERGMLKIDAMSLADTLEGYPDMFVSALVGDALIAGGIGGKTTESSPRMQDRNRPTHGSIGGGPGVQDWGAGDLSHPMADQEAGWNGSFLNWKFPSYADHMDELDQVTDPDAAFVGSAMTESRREGLFMMLGFSLFAVIPSLIYLTVPMMITLDHHANSSSSHSSSSSEMKQGVEIVRASSGIATSCIMVSVAAVIMWCLGVWKSQFVDSNWMLFGIETVVVMLFCIGAAYGLGALLSACIPNLDASILNDSGSSEKESL